MSKLKNYVQGKWIEGDGDGAPLFNAITGEQIGTATTKGIDFAEMLSRQKSGWPIITKNDFSRAW